MIFNFTAFNDGGGGATLYSITNDSPSYLDIDKAQADEGETVTVTTIARPPRPSWVKWALDGVSLVNGTTLLTAKQYTAAGKTATFTMPADNVHVGLSSS